MSSGEHKETHKVKRNAGAVEMEAFATPKAAGGWPCVVFFAWPPSCFSRFQVLDR